MQHDNTCSFIYYVLAPGEWSEWEDGECSVTCGTGQMMRTRNCNNPEGGEDCVGEPVETVSCNKDPCLGKN